MLLLLLLLLLFEGAVARLLSYSVLTFICLVIRFEKGSSRALEVRVFIPTGQVVIPVAFFTAA